MTLNIATLNTTNGIQQNDHQYKDIKYSGTQHIDLKCLTKHNGLNHTQHNIIQPNATLRRTYFNVVLCRNTECHNTKCHDTECHVIQCC